MKYLLALSLLSLVFLLVLISSNLGINLWNLLVGRGYIVPNEASILTFEPTVMNDGSGEWWLYGEDSSAYYAFIGSVDRQYVRFPRATAKTCKGFDPHDLRTWCGQSPSNR